MEKTDQKKLYVVLRICDRYVECEHPTYGAAIKAAYEYAATYPGIYFQVAKIRGETVCGKITYTKFDSKDLT